MGLSMRVADLFTKALDTRGLLHAGWPETSVNLYVYSCVYFTSDSIRKMRSQAATLLTETTPCLQLLSYRTQAPSGRAVRLRFSTVGALDGHAACLEPLGDHPPSDGE